MSRPHFAIAAAVPLLGAFSVSCALAVTGDAKGVAARLCEPYAPGTTAAELQRTQTGVYNPGTTVEKVICPLPRDQDLQYAATGLQVGAYCRVLGAAFAAPTCTVFVGSCAVHGGAVVNATGTGESVNNGERNVMRISVNGAQDTLLTVVPNALICTVPPKVVIGGIDVQETGATHTPSP